MFIFYSLLNLIVLLMFPTKIKPFQNLLFQERIFICFICFICSWRRRNVHILFSSKSDRFAYVSNQNKAVSKLIISQTHMYMFHMFYMFHGGGITVMFYSLLNPIVFLMFPTKIYPFQNRLFQGNIFICFICFIYVSWRRRNFYILFSS